MFFLLFFIVLIQFFTYWIFEPLTSFMANVVEIRFFPVIAFVGLIFIFSAKKIEHE